MVRAGREQGPGRTGSFELVSGADMARSTVWQAVQTLVAFNLVQQRTGRWSIIAATSLAILAQTLGCAAETVDRFNRHRRGRGAFRRVMRVVTYLETAVGREFYDPVIDGTGSAQAGLERILRGPAADVMSVMLWCRGWCCWARVVACPLTRFRHRTVQASRSDGRAATPRNRTEIRDGGGKRRARQCPMARARIVDPIV